jgi:hypothetical protein
MLGGKVTRVPEDEKREKDKSEEGGGECGWPAVTIF